MDYQSRPAVRPKKRRRDRLIRLAATQPTWTLGFVDEVWWSRVAQPPLHAWAADQPLRLIEQTRAKDDPDPKALACYGVLLPALDQIWVRFVDGRPVSSSTTQFLAWVCERLAARGTTAWLLIWDNASWHVSREVRAWIADHNQRVKRDGGVRIVSCRLPVKSPWLNPIEPHWVHGKRRVVEPARLLTADELAKRVCATFGCVHEPHLSIPDQVA
ncbi:MAG TPA: transposase [Chloroflexota bacterium]|nr:transposase [Chloroflexota bacterium]